MLLSSYFRRVHVFARQVVGLFPHAGGVVHVDGLKKYVWETFIALSITSFLEYKR